MDEKSPVTKLRVNLSPVAEHRRQMRWQVWAPLIASVVIFLALAVLAVIGAVQGSSQVARFGNLSAVWIITPVLLVGLVFLVITAGLAYGMAKLLNRVPDWMLRAQLMMEHLALSVRRGADAATKPVMATSGLKARAVALWRRVTGKPVRAPQAGMKQSS